METSAGILLPDDDLREVGVPLMCDEGDDFQTFRIGLCGLDKLHPTERSVDKLEAAIERVNRES